MATANKKKGVYCIEGLWNHRNIEDKSAILPILYLLEKKEACSYIYLDFATESELEFFSTNGKTGRTEMSLLEYDFTAVEI